MPLHQTVVFPLQFDKVKSLSFLFFLSAALSFLCSHHKVFTLFQRRKVLNESCKSCPVWTWDLRNLNRRCLDALRKGAQWRPLATGGLWFLVRPWTHAARSWMAPYPPLETRGQGATTSIQPPDLLPWPLERLMSSLSTLVIGLTWLSRAAYVTGVIYIKIDRWPGREEGRHLLWFATQLLLSGCDPQQGCSGLCWVFLWSLRGAGCKLGFIAGKWMGQVPAVACR